MKKIIIFGFPHSGTSILKSIIGHIPEVYEELYEKKIITDEDLKKIPENKKYILIKFPFTYNEYFTSKYNDYIKIFIIRNPIYIFSSLNKRFNYKLPSNHSINFYIETCKLYLKYNKKIDNTYFIKYEDLFYNEFENLKNILNNIGFIYNNEIFNNANYKNYISKKINNIPNKKVDNKDHDRYRTWQINQPFEFCNSPDKIDLTEEQIDIIINNKIILELYPNIKDDIKDYIKDDNN